MDTEERKRIAAELDAAGASLEEVRVACGYKSVAPAGRLLAQVRKEAGQPPAEPKTAGRAPTQQQTSESAERARPATQRTNLTDAQRLDQLLDTLWPDALAGQFGAIDRVLDILKRRGPGPQPAPPAPAPDAGKEVTPVDRFTDKLRSRSADPNAQGVRGAS